MRELPTGTVTLLFTDVEGSTRLLAEHGERYPDLLAEQRRLLREAFASHGGVEVDTQGDAFLVAFARATDALAAARDAQAALEPTPVRVRIGVHTGEPVVTGEGYVGMDVHTGARIAAAAHGGQVLVSEQTAALAGVEGLVDLGLHRLKDVGELRLFQAGDGEFPPLKTLHRASLPTPANPLVGRKKELAELLRLVARERARVVTITGPGGIGKTRFSLAVAAEAVDAFPGGVSFVDLSPVRDPALVVPTLAQTLGADADLAQHIGDRAILLVLDNFEQVVEAAGDVARLVASCPRLQLLVTSREPLRIGGERQYALRPLPESPAVELFRQRARAALAGVEVAYDVAAAICDRLDRLPLAIELAAARVGVFDPESLLSRLDRRLPLLTSRARDVGERQRTLTATIAWSYELLSPEERALFRRLAVFAGGSTLDAAERVAEADADLLEALVDKSLLRRRADRFLMLETIREFASGRLDESDEADTGRRRHADFVLALAESANLTALADGEQRHELVAGEQDNIRAALQWTLERGEVELGLQLAIAAENWWVTASPDEGYGWVSALLERADDGAVSGKLLADALRACASTTYIVGDYELGTSFIERSLEEYRRLGDEQGVGHMQLRLAVEARRVGDDERARRLATESLESARRAGFRRGESQALTVLAGLEFAEDRPERGIELLERAVGIAREIGFSWWEATVLLNLARRALGLGRPEDAGRWARESLLLARRMDDRQTFVFGIAIVAGAAAATGRPELAGRLWGAVEAEEARAPVGQWGEFREEFAAHVLGQGGEDFERARVQGRTLTLVDAVNLALADA